MEETHAVKSPPRKRNRKILFDEGLAEVDEMELEFTVNTGSSDESDDLEWELETGDVSTENDVLTDYALGGAASYYPHPRPYSQPIGHHPLSSNPTHPTRNGLPGYPYKKDCNPEERQEVALAFVTQLLLFKQIRGIESADPLQNVRTFLQPSEQFEQKDHRMLHASIKQRLQTNLTEQKTLWTPTRRICTIQHEDYILQESALHSLQKRRVNIIYR
ncbi:hypothetical protein GEV33_009806 [Tenebrio molitor]|uniref:Uncharacterized protein n=1 Tax=Tenebrio molitor TaxID=7067 RepID=A0A8J6HE47_TENMO|nr:hypothetical protein GEV33_009806 [Tenebrio molitor]